MAVVCAAAALVAPAQTAPVDAVEPSRMDAIVVTGSNLPSTAGTASVPVASVNGHDMAQTGEGTDILSMLRKALPQFAGSGNEGLENAGSQAFYTMGGSSLCIHNLSTLVLIDGRRVAFDPAEAAVGGEFVDLNMIPASAVDRIEVVSDGASAIYGSDAVGGVVNVILKSSFNGWDAGARFGESDNAGHYSERSAFLTGGVSRAGTSLVVSVEAAEVDPVYASERAYSAQLHGTTSYPGVIDVLDLQTGADTYYRLNPSLNAPPGGGQYSIDQLVQNGVYVPLTYPQLLGGYNQASQQTLSESLKRRSLVVNFSREIQGNRLEAFGNLIAAQTRTQSSIPGQSVSAYVSTPLTDLAEYGTTPPPPGPYGFLPYVPSGSASSPFAPAWVGQGYLVTAHDKFTQDPVLSQDRSALVRAVAGLRGRIGERYSWEAGVNLNRYHVAYSSPGQVDTAALNAAIAAGAFNPFAYGQTGALPAGVLGTKTDDMLSLLESIDFILRGSPLDLPGGRASLAVGASFAREHLTASPDANSLPGAEGVPAWLSYQSLSPFNAYRDVSSAFAEVKVPILGEAHTAPGFHSLTLDATGRVDAYTLVGRSAVPGASLAWQPVDEQLSIRVSAERSFAAPQLYDLYGPVQFGQTPPISFADYGGGYTYQAIYNGYSGPNSNLSPASANTGSAGVVYAPRALGGLTVSADYFEAFDRNEIGYLSIQDIVQSAELLGAASPFSRFVHFGSPAGAPVTGPGQLSAANPSTVYIEVPVINLSSQTIRGLDASLSYSTSLEEAGRIELVSNLTVFNSFLVQALPTQRFYQYAGDASGLASSSQGTIPRWRTRSSATWSHRGCEVTVAQTYVPSVTDIGPGGASATAPVKVPSFQSYDLIVGFDLSRIRSLSWAGHLSARVGADNVFNRMPPAAPNAFPTTNADVGTYGGAVGRLWFVEGDYRF